jgi:saccharopine dehydrogenase-like NADP-dependent oxidoreductase
VFPYSAQTIVEELTLPPWVFRNGKFRQTKPRSGWERVRFPKPVGPQWVVRTRHSEVATLPVRLRLRDCDFKVGFERAFVREVMRRWGRGWTVRDFAKLPAPGQRPDDYEIARVIVEGAAGGGGRGRRGRRRVVVMDCHARAKPEWGASAGDVDTGCPASIVAQMIASGEIARRGVLPPEVAVPVEAFFRELRKRGLRIEVRR